MFDAMVVRTQSLLAADEPLVPLMEQAFASAALSRLNGRVSRSVLRGTLTYLSGPEGIGKSFLARAAVREIHRHQSRFPPLITTAPDLAAALVAAEARQDLADTLEQFLRVRILVCDDLQGLEERPVEQEVLLELVDTLLANGTHVLLTCRKLPGELREFSPRWVSRCHGGLCAAIPPLSRDSRREFLAWQARNCHLPLARPSGPTIDFLADRIVGGPRDLSETVSKLAQSCREQSILLDLPVLETWWSDAGPSHQPTLEAILIAVALEFGIDAEELRSRSRHQMLIVPRQCAMYLARELTGQPLEAIGRFFGDRTHTTVSHSLSRLKEILPSAPTLRQQVQRLRKRIAGLRSDCA